ncbi:MAG: SusC/RagA family TonB-linked outer membrane protein [Bacteroidota bacterium]
MQNSATGKFLPRLTHQTLLFMRMLTVFILAACVQVHANVSAQTVTYSAKNAPIEKVFKEIKRQTGYGFMYSSNIVKVAKPVTIEADKTDLKEVLDACFLNQPFTYELNGKTVVVKERVDPPKKESGVSEALSAPPVDVHGVVKDETGKPVVGASVQVKGTNKGTTTNELGEFILIGVDDKATIVISAVNIETREVGINGRKEISLVAKVKISKLEDVEITNVNTGYQSLPKERATGSFEKIDNKLFNQQVSTTVLNRLETIANGLYFDKKTNTASPRIAIRGISSILGPTAPLIILDNFPYEGDLANINPNDVESVTLLKDAAAASIWGARAGNGVIVITTKNAKIGQPLKIELHNSVTIEEKPNLFYYKNMTSSDYIDAELFLYNKGFYNSQISSVAKSGLAPVIELLVKKANGSMNAAEVDSRINALRSIDIRNEYNKYMYQVGINTQHAFTLSTGSNNSSHIFSAGFDNNTSVLGGKLSRISIRNNSSFRINNRTQLIAGITYTQSNTIAGRTGYDGLSSSPGILPLYTQLADVNGNALPVTVGLRIPYVDTVGRGKLVDWHYYALDEHKHVDNRTDLQSFIGNATLTYKIIKGLSADIKYQYESQNINNNIVNDIGSYYTRNLINTFSQLNYTTGSVTYKVPYAGILRSNNTKIEAHNIRGQLSYTRQWKSHELNAIAGTEVRSTKATGSSLVTYGYNADILSVIPMDFVNLYPTFVTGSNALIPSDQNFSSVLNRYVSFFGNAAYTFKSKYSFSISGRRDASNLFGVRTNNKWTPLWSTGFAWDISKEKFYALKHLPTLRLRATYGYSGNVDPNRSGFTVSNAAVSSIYTLLPTATLSQFSNPDLRWERMGILNLGADFKAFDNRLQGSIEYYHKNGKDLLGFTPVDYTTVPASRLAKNVASIKANGWDVNISSINIRAPFIWETNINFNYNNDKVTDYFITNRSAINYLSGGLSISAFVGQPVYGIYVYPWAGLDPQSGDPMGFLNGKASKDYNTLVGSSWPIDSLKYAGPSMPRFFGSIGNSFSYKGLTLSIRVSFKMGYYFLPNSINYNNLFSDRKGHIDYEGRWQKPGDEQFTTIPSLVYPADSRRDQFYNNSEILVQKADHIRLQYITLNYNVKSIFKRLPVKNLDMYININNLGLIWRANDRGIDPDYRDNTILPSKTYAIGIRTSL